MQVRVLRNKENKIVGYAFYPKKDGEMMELEEVLKYMKEEKTEAPSVDKDKLLSAFKEYRSDVFYGIVQETEDEHNEILNWYQRFQNGENVEIPKKIKVYLEDK